MNGLRTTALGIGLLTLGTSGMAAAGTPFPRANTSRAAIVARTHRPDARSLYSRQALREMRAYLRLRMLELREDDLDRVREVIEHRLSIDALIGPGETPVSQPR